MERALTTKKEEINFHKTKPKLLKLREGVITISGGFQFTAGNTSDGSRAIK